jgi:hypothetical protein
MTMGPVGERFAGAPRQFDTVKTSVPNRPSLAVDLKGSTPRAIVQPQSYCYSSRV